MKEKSITFIPTKKQYEMILKYRTDVGVPVSVTIRKAVDYYFENLLNAPNFKVKKKNGVET